MSRNQNKSSGPHKSADFSQSSSQRSNQIVSGYDKPQSLVKLRGSKTVAAWLTQLGRTVWSPVSNLFQKKAQAGKGVFPRFLFWTRNRSRDVRSSVFRIVESIRSNIAKSPQFKSYRPPDETLLVRTERGGNLVPGQEVQRADSRLRRVRRVKDRSELPKHLVTGSQGEQIALDYFLQKGWILIDRNVRALGGEIDLVMLDQGTIVFVEVKTWGSKTDEDPAEAVDLYKQRTLTRVGLAYLSKKRWLDKPARFDVVSVRITVENSDANGEKQGAHLRHFPYAFESQGNSFFG